MSTNYNIGRIGLNLRGDFDAEASYEKLDVVFYNGSSYAAKTTCTGVHPTDVNSWMKLAVGMPSTISTMNDLYRLGIQGGLTEVLDVPSNKITEYRVVFPKPFLEGTVPICIPVFFTASVGLTMANVSVVAYAPTHTGFLARCINNSSSGRAPCVSWIAIGIPDPALIDE